MFQKLAGYLFVKRLDPDVQRKIDRDNLTFFRMMSLCVMVIESVMLVAYGVFGDPAAAWHTLRIWCYISYFLLSALSYILSTYVIGRKKSHTALMAVGLSYCAGAIIWGMVISATDFIGGKQIFVFITNVLCVAGFAFIKPGISIPFFTSLFGVFYFVLVFVCGANFTFPVNYSILLFMVILTSVTRYHTKLSDAKARVEAERLNRKLEWISFHDELTSVKNRHSFTRDIRGYFDKPLRLLLIDIDNFKLMNDTFGHDYGDELLREFTRLLQEQFPGQDIFRYGGDEFIVATENGTSEILLESLRSFQDTLSHLCIRGSEQSVTISGGYTIGRPQGQEDIDRMLRQADAALYQSKRNGKNQVQTLPA